MTLGRFDAGDVPLQSGETLHGAWIGYATWGRLDPSGTNCVLFPTGFTGTHVDNAALVGRGRALDPGQWFIVVPNLIGNGASCSPSNSRERYPGGAFPAVSVYDNVACQKALLDSLGVRRVRLALGWSLGATQAWHWAALHADAVDNVLAVCGAARCWPYTRTILQSLRAVLSADSAYAGGAYTAPPARGLRGFARGCVPWAHSAAFFREGRYRELGHASGDDLARAWDDEYAALDANDVLCRLRTWADADVGAHGAFGGSAARAMAAVRARCVLMPCERDQMCAAAEVRMEAALAPVAEVRALASSAGHSAGAPGRYAPETALIEAAIAELLAGPTPPRAPAAPAGAAD